LSPDLPRRIDTWSSREAAIAARRHFAWTPTFPPSSRAALARSAPNEGRCCIHCGCATFSDSPAFEPDGKWDGSTRRLGVNARLFDDFDAALASIVVIDGKHLWQPWQEG